MVKKVVIACLLFFVWQNLVVAQPNVSITTLSGISGLSQNTINCLFKDRYGFMWFGTQDGLNKYDGYKVTVYKHNINNPQSLPANHITTICEDKAGNLWVGTRTAGISRYDRSRDVFVNFITSASNSSISSNSITIAYTDKRSNLWIGTANGLNLFEATSGRFKRYSRVAKDVNTLSDNTITAIFEDDDKRLWIGTANSLNLFDRATGKFKRYIDKEKNNGGNFINSICEDDNHQLWLGTNQGLKCFNIDKNTFSYYPVEEDAYSADGVNPVFTVQKTNGNKFWLGTNTTLQMFDANTKRLVPINNKAVAGSPMPNDGIYAMLEDAGILWIGTTSQGVLKYDKNLSLFPAYNTSLAQIPSAKNIIRGIAEDKAGNLYLATDVGLEYYNRNSGIHQTYLHSKTNTNSLLSNYTTAVTVSKKTGMVWIGTYSSGLDKFDPKSRSFTHYVQGSKQLSSNYIYTLLEDSKGNIWIGTDAGLNVIDKTGKVTVYLNTRRGKGKIEEDVIQALLEDKQGNIWIGNYTNGISIFNPVSKSFTHLNTKNSKLNSDVISSLCEDKLGNIWVGTMEGGLNFYDIKRKEFTACYNEQNGLINNTINYITQDSKGFLWLTTNQGIVRFDPIKKKYRTFCTSNGLKTLEFNIQSGIQLSSGELAFGSINGFNIINPLQLNFNVHPPSVVLTDFELFNKPLTNYSNKSPLKQTLLTSKSVTLNYDQSVFSIAFAALDYTLPSQNKYAYQLEGFDDEWRIGTQRKATYTNLDPGKYTFRVKGANNDGVWSKNIASLIIIIKPPFWMTWWFRGLCIALVLGGVYMVYYLRVRYLNKQKDELQKQVKERTHALQLQTEELQQQSKELLLKSTALEQINKELNWQKAQEEKARKEADKANKAKSTFLATMSHEIRTPMNGVLGMASLLTETKLDNEQREYTDAILTSGESLLNLINDVLDFSKIESGHMQLDPHDFELRKCIEDVLELFSSKSFQSGVDLMCHIDNNVPIFINADSFRLKQVLANLVSNAVKFTSKGEIVITVTASVYDTNQLKLNFTVKDTGIGIAEDKISKLFKAFNQLDSSVTRKYGGTGLGLVISERLVKLLGGSITVKSKINEGSTFSFDIKCKKSKASVQPYSGNMSICENKKALIIDDNSTNLLILDTQLSKLNMEVFEAYSGQRALTILQDVKDIDIIITDMQMPDMDGVEASKKIKAIYPEIPIVLLSSIGNETQREHPGLFEYVLTKPVRQQALYNTIEAVLQKPQGDNKVQTKKILSADFAAKYPFRILVAEDNPLNQKLILRVLNKLGYQPHLANDGQEVLNILKEQTFDIILMDIQMPNLDGLQATKLIRQTYGDKPLILALTANAMNDDKEVCLNAGMNGYLSKPLKLKMLVEALAAFYQNI
ncbi:MAG: hybrid sensor histidine kinase/response regulator [Sphingobacteriaceae bacterium]|nr:MAG: hybrid sensor histidine kinase/response regulator [Sphingobacteriaceae bacterium]